MRVKQTDSELLLPGEAGKLLDVSAARVRQLIDAGRLEALRTVSGRRLVVADSVDRLIAERKRAMKNVAEVTE